ncbi:glycosyltransferase family 2 protein [Candidatus Collierbacteria bacterium]|nr:glycosyltransferase family 2 protein [Candidatus Collierbacteria bacterium]
MIDISVIILSYNTKDLTLACLRSAVKDLKNSSLNAEIIVLDNASTDGSAEMLKHFRIQNSEFRIQNLYSQTNLGFAKGNNLAAKKAAGKWLLFLNSDTEVTPGTFKEMKNFLSDNPEVGIVSCNLLNPDGTIQQQGGYLPKLSTVAFWALFLDDLPVFSQFLPSYQLRRKSFFSGGPQKTGWVAGTAMWVSNVLWKKLNGFDESLFMYGEDVELCLRAGKLGWDIMLNPKASIVHLGKAGGGKWIQGEINGLKHIFKIHKPSWEMPLLKAILGLGMISRWLIFGILKGNGEYKRNYFEAFKSALAILAGGIFIDIYSALPKDSLI